MSSSTAPPTNNGDGAQVFDVSKFRVPQNFAEQAGVRKAVVSVPVGRPNRQDFIRVREGEEWTLETAILKIHAEREHFLVLPEVHPYISNELTYVTLFTYITRDGVVGLWPVRMPRADGKQDRWAQSQMQAALMAKTKWVKVSSNMSAGAYDVAYATGQIPEPTWPEESFSQLVKLAFDGHIIDSPSHPVIKKLLGVQ